MHGVLPSRLDSGIEVYTTEEPVLCDVFTEPQGHVVNGNDLKVPPMELLKLASPMDVVGQVTRSFTMIIPSHVSDTHLFGWMATGYCKVNDYNELHPVSDDSFVICNVVMAIHHGREFLAMYSPGPNLSIFVTVMAGSQHPRASTEFHLRTSGIGQPSALHLVRRMVVDCPFCVTRSIVCRCTDRTRARLFSADSCVQRCWGDLAGRFRDAHDQNMTLWNDVSGGDVKVDVVNVRTRVQRSGPHSRIVKQILHQMNMTHPRLRQLEYSSASQFDSLISDIRSDRNPAPLLTKTEWTRPCDSTITDSRLLEVEEKPQSSAKTVQYSATDQWCTLCGDKVISFLELHRHHEKVHIVRKRGMGFQCLYCPKKFGQNAHLEAHIIAVHDKARVFVCGLCHRRFSSRSNLLRHARVAGHQENDVRPSQPARRKEGRV
eukprot:Plantae.Rhodophyta-Rhodochaete_pulchella.ctg1804.p1 GENE.Plantae.Rhodophyta-Rhodochaete_pulchella.ctg1804~~Plantae.Rhodophyta-Rhodochaete_pulchella.ctg1804.p1  ORF type:complete len:432 (+),score=28.00 Plantae.Rhodophyta-Rhodochaete_pulchella.ctg1804:51-1346(+)